MLKFETNHFSPTWVRFRDFCGVFLICLVVLIGTLHFSFSQQAGLVLLYMPWGIALISLLGFAIWFKRYKDFFESFLIYISLVATLFSFLIMAPFVVERSLSCFIYFQAVENQQVNPAGISSDFTKSFIQKRFDDGVLGGFLKQKGGNYYPTFRSKMFYTLYYPLGRMTGTLNNYLKFKDSYETKK